VPIAEVTLNRWKHGSLSQNDELEVVCEEAIVVNFEVVEAYSVEKLRKEAKRNSNNTLKLIWWGVESSWVHSALRSPIGLLCQPRVIIMMEKLVE
jgi:hypothetical protein